MTAPWQQAAWLGALSVSFAWAAWELSGLGRRELDAARRFAEGVAASVRRVVARARGSCRARPGVRVEEVSEMADVVRLGMSAGLSFDAALALYCEYRQGPLPSLMARALLSWQVGAATRAGALDRAAEESGQGALGAFARVVVQGLEMGAPLAESLERQSLELRAQRRAEVERRIERAPVQILIPTGTLILPALMLAILGPLMSAGGML